MKQSFLTRCLLLALFALSSTAGAVVTRHDVDDTKYRVPASEFPALVDLPGEGHGVLIAPQWVITAAHAVSWQHAVEEVSINGICRAVERVVVHPGYRKLPQELIDQALSTGDATLVRALLASSDDIALVKLARPVTDVAPAARYGGNDEPGQIAKILGKGATGNGAVGFGKHASHRTELRRAFNTVTSADGRWFCYVFDNAPSTAPLEGMSGNGDSGGPVLIQVENQWRLAGLTSWTSAPGDIRTIAMGLYGQTSCNVRLSHYSDWIESNLSPPPKPVAQR